ncbi:MAG: hypothetical protein LBR24_01950 [Methanobrevibacter sp.]|nr:hypothetical protein [Methanobrevibacter sp.]
MKKAIKNIIFVLLVLIVSMMIISNVNAVTYSFSNSTDVDNISKMISGKMPMKNGKYIKNGDVVKFKAGNYYNIKLIINKRITIKTTKNGKNKVLFIGKITDYTGPTPFYGLKLKYNKIKISGIKLKTYDYGIYGRTNNSKISQVKFYKVTYGIRIKGAKNEINKNKFTKCTYGLIIRGKNNLISSNRINNSILAVEISSINNKIKKNVLSNLNTGIHLNGDKNTVTDNKIIKAITGIYVERNKNKISHNTLLSSKSEGIFVIGLNNIITLNKIFKSEMGIGYVTGNTIKNNIFKSNKINLKFYESKPGEW